MFEYSNIGFSILGLAIQRAAGRDYFAMQREIVRTPLGMQDTGYGFNLSPEQWKRVAKGYFKQSNGQIDEKVPLAEHKGRGFPVPAGSLYSSLNDLAAYVAMLSGAAPKVLAPSAREVDGVSSSPHCNPRARHAGILWIRIVQPALSGRNHDHLA